MGRIDARQGPFARGGREEEKDRQPDIFEQAERVLRGEPPIPKDDIFTQAERVLRGLPPRESSDILAEAERKIGESECEGDVFRWAQFGRIPDDKVTFSNSPPPAYPGGPVLRASSEDRERFYAVPIPDDKVTFSNSWPSVAHPVRAGKAGGDLSATREMVAMAGAKGWEIEGRTAVALRGATLSGLAQAITGDPNDYKLLDFKRDPRTLQEGEKVKIMPLLDKAAYGLTPAKDLEQLAKERLPAMATPPAGLEKGEYLGTFRITVYNTAREWDHPARPTRKAPGLAREYSVAFLRDIDMQGSGIDREGRLIQHTWRQGKIAGYTYVDTIRTASGEPVRQGWSAAVDPSIVPPGTWIFIEGVGRRKTVDTGEKIKQRKIDVYFAVSRKEAYTLDKQEQRVWRAK